MVLLGIIVTLGLNLFLPGKTIQDSHYYDFIISIVITILVWEGNLQIDHWLNKKYPWLKMPGKRVLIHFTASVLYSGVVIFIASFLFNILSDSLPVNSKDFVKVTLTILGVLVLMSVILLTIEVSTQFFHQWKNSLLEVEKYRAESLQAQLQNLKNQLNPHFLFNNLSVLSSLVYRDPDKSVEFINQLSKVYRYLLDNQNSELVSLFQEWEFIKSYIYLLHIRFDRNLIIETDIRKEEMGSLIPPMALQILIENAIKHNEASSEHPLTITITTVKGLLTVSNNLQIRPLHEPGSQTGLKNICARYKFFTDIQPEIVKTPDAFIVTIPLLSSK
jgi:two-component system LytT family sensor kinase